jgi:hypothetical protein
MSNNTNTWNEVCTTWDTTCFNWSPCIAEVAAIVEEGGARDPQYWGDHPYDLYNKEKELYDYQYEQPEKRKRLIQIYIKCHEKKFNKTIQMPDKDIFIKIKDVEFILNEIRSVGVDIKNIRKYNDNELQNLLG